MLTGDNAQTASAVAKQVGLKNFKAEVLPAQKSEFIKELQGKGKVVAMVKMVQLHQPNLSSVVNFLWDTMGVPIFSFQMVFRFL
jgi:high-affinity K+ transport system ATPase subunit B